MPQSIDSIELRSEEVQEILSAPPAWLVRWGITVLLLLILLLGVIAGLVEYPDVIAGDIVLTTQSPPVKITTYNSGNLVKLLKSEGDFLQAGEMIAEIESPITQKGIDYMRELIEKVDEFLVNPSEPIIFLDSNYVFGSIQTNYNDLKKLCDDYYQWVKDTYSTKQLKSLRAKIEQYNRLMQIADRQALIAHGELSNAQEKYEVDRMLYQEGVLAKLQFYQQETAFRQQQQELENFKKSVAQNKIALIELREQLLDIQHKQKESERNFREGIRLNIHSIRNQLEEWQRNYLIKTPVAGRLSYLRNLSSNEFVEAGNTFFAVIPENENYRGIITVPTQGLGKVKVGQRVRIKVYKFPYQEYGQLYGNVGEISLLAHEDNYRIDVILPQDLTTTYHKKLVFSPEMSGTAEIVTENLSIMDRVFYPFKSILNHTTRR
jgi:HlyD family secretion protein